MDSGMYGYCYVHAQCSCIYFIHVSDNNVFQAPVVQRVDNAIHRINHYPVDSVVYFVNTYPLDSDLSGG